MKNQKKKPRNQAEFALTAEDLLHVFFAESTDGVLFVDNDGIIASANESACELTGYSQGELLKSSINSLIPYLKQTSKQVLKRKVGSDILAEISFKALSSGSGSVVVIRDLSEMQGVERHLRESEERFKAIFNSINAAIFIQDIDSGKIVDVNQRMLDMYGYSYEEVLSKEIGDFSENVAPYDQKAAIEWLEKTVDGPQTLDWRARDRSGRLFWVEVSMCRAQIGAHTRLLVVVRDITERKNTEEALRFTQFSVDRAADSLLWLDAEANIIYANDAACRAVKYSREELLAMKIHELDPDFPPEAWLPHIAELKQRGAISFESIHKTKDGHIFPVEVTGNYFEYNGKFYSFAFDRDITARKQAEAALRQSEERFRTLLQKVPAIAIQGYSLNGIVTYWNQASETLYGFSEAEAIGANILDLIIPAEDQERVRVEMNLMEQTGTVMPSREGTRKKKSGDVVTVFSNFTIVTLPGREPELFCLDIDRTSQILAENEKEVLQKQLLQAQKMESVGRLAGGVAHDFNNMLTAILGHAQMAMLKCPKQDKIAADLKVIEESAIRSADLVRQLLAFARKQTVAPKVLDLNDTAEGMLKMLKRLIGEDIDLVWNPGPDLWSVKIDPTQVDQLLANLCVNARDAISGVGAITIETKNVVVDENYCATHVEYIPGEYVMLAVSDNGCGMKKEVLEKLFEPFFTTKEIGKGTGLGLATVYGIVKQNKGFINVYSEPGIGSTFKIFFSKHEGEAGHVEREKITVIPKGNNETILLVEDEEVILNLGKKLLEELNYRVLAARTPSQAVMLAAANISELTLLITDVVMPEMNGRELAKLLLNLKPNLKCLFASGYTANVIAHQGILDEGVNFLQKPFTLEGMARKIREVVKQEAPPKV